MVITVEDNGIGIASASIDKVFQKYSRLDDNTDGNGIGLYLVKEIVESSGGRIEVQSKENVGSTFKVFFKLLS